MTERRFTTTLATLSIILGMTLSGAAVAQSQSGQPAQTNQPSRSEQSQPASEQASPSDGAGQSAQGDTAGQQASDRTDAGGDGGTAQQSSVTLIEKQESSQMLASSVIGMPVQDGAGENAQELGDVADLILDENHRIVGVLIGVGGVVGIGAKYVGVPLSAVQVDQEAGIMVVDLTPKQLEQASGYATLAEQKEKQQQQQMKQQMQQQRQQQTQSMGAIQ